MNFDNFILDKIYEYCDEGSLCMLSATCQQLYNDISMARPIKLSLNIMKLAVINESNSMIDYAKSLGYDWNGKPNIILARYNSLIYHKRVQECGFYTDNESESDHPNLSTDDNYSSIDDNYLPIENDPYMQSLQYTVNTDEEALIEIKNIHMATKASFSGRLCAMMAADSNLVGLRYLHENGCPWDESTCMNAIMSGSLQCLIYAHINGCPWSIKSCITAVQHDRVECLQYLHENGCPWDESVTFHAAQESYECLKYAHENGCPWNKWTCINAATLTHDRNLYYAYTHGCPWDELVIIYAIINKSLHCLKFAINNGCPLSQKIMKWAYAVPYNSDDYELYRYINKISLNYIFHDYIKAKLSNHKLGQDVIY